MNDVEIRRDGSRDEAPSALERLHEVEAGQYWRTRGPVPPRTEGGTRPALPANRVYLVSSLRYADGTMHAVWLAPHPSERVGGGPTRCWSRSSTTSSSAPTTGRR